MTERQESEREFQSQISKLQAEKQSLLDSLSRLQSALDNVDNAKIDAERAAGRFEKDKHAMLRTLEKVFVFAHE